MKRAFRRTACSGMALVGLVLPHTLAQPLITPDAAVLNLDEIGLYTMGYAYRGQPEVEFPLGWSGFFEDATGVACLPYGVQSGKRVFLLHSPWRGGTGLTFQQFNVNLPARATRVVLRGATALRPDIVGKSDGATFRIFANGVKQLDWHQTNDVWRPFEFDFTAWRGSNLVLRFEVDPGPKQNPAWDYSFWGDRALVLEGYTPPARSNPAPLPLALTNVFSAQTGEVAPLSGFAGRTSVQFADDTVRLRYGGPDGALEYEWQRPLSETAPLFGTITLKAQMTSQSPVSVPLANSAKLSWIGTAKPVSSTWEATSNGCALVRTFNLAGSNVLVRIAGQLVGKSLVLAVSCDHPVVTAFDAGAWGPTSR